MNTLSATRINGSALTSTLQVKRYLERWVGSRRAAGERLEASGMFAEAMAAYAEAMAFQQTLAMLARTDGARLTGEHAFRELSTAVDRMNDRLMEKPDAQAVADEYAARSKALWPQVKRQVRAERAAEAQA
jgi:hypothetical protein